jgi:hypothetical protein
VLTCIGEIDRRALGSEASDTQVGQKSLNLRSAHLLRVAFFVIEDEATDPVDIRLFRAIRVMFGTQGEPQAVKQLRRLGRWNVA